MLILRKDEIWDSSLVKEESAKKTGEICATCNNWGGLGECEFSKNLTINPTKGLVPETKSSL